MVEKIDAEIEDQGSAEALSSGVATSVPLVVYTE